MNNPFDIAMDLSDGKFAHHLYGVLSYLHENGDTAPDVDAEATEYLNTFYAGWDDPEDPGPMDDGWMDEDAFASAGFGMDESYE